MLLQPGIMGAQQFEKVLFGQGRRPEQVAHCSAKQREHGQVNSFRPFRAAKPPVLDAEKRFVTEPPIDII
jgi:hypothetical protein